MSGKILITPNAGSTTTDPTIAFQGAGVSTDILLRVPSTGGLSFEGTSGQLFSITDTMAGTIFSANDVSGIPSIEVLDSGLIKLGQYGGNVLLGKSTDNGSKLQVNGKIQNGSIWINNGDDYDGYNENIRLFSAGNGVSTIALGATGITGAPNAAILGYSYGIDIRIGTGGTVVHSFYNNYSYARGSSRAPIFYDSDNTGYYTDPNGTSNVNAINAATLNGATVQVNNYSSTTSLWFNSPGPWVNAYGSGTSTQQINFLTVSSSNLVNLSCTGNVIAYASDKRLKGNIRPIENALSKVMSLHGIIYNWNDVAKEFASFDTTVDEVGIFAQEVQTVLPQVVKPAPFDMDYEKNISKSGQNYLTVDYERMVPLLIEAIKEQQSIINSQEERLVRLETMLNTLVP